MSTCTITETEPAALELQRIPSAPKIQADKVENLAPSASDSIRDDGAPPPGAVDARQRWNSPPGNTYRTLACFWSFLVVGMNDGSYGALIPFLEPYYDLNYTVVSLIFLSPFAGYGIASAVNNLVHVHFGQRGVAFMAPLCHIVPFLVISFHPPFPVLVIMYIFVGFGNGLTDAAWCTFIGQMANEHQVSGVLQACYALGATVAPLIATAMVTNGGLGWYDFYYVMLGGAVIELVTSAWAFRAQTGAVYLAENPFEDGAKSGRTRQALKNKYTWIFALFIFGYVGAEVSLGGWIVTFMTRVRNASQFAGGAAATGFWGGMTAGRLFLSVITSRLGEFKSMVLYIGLTIAFELVFWLVPNLIVTAVSAAIMGVLMGPMFPTAVVLITKVLPRSLHVGTIGFATAFGGSGGAILPFVVGALAQAKGVESLQPFILAVLVALGLLWASLSRSTQKEKVDPSGETGEATANLD
ncbi:MFS general substrate transporter [Thozetella sp. PMI_491]|nr:MFS general substrate transporter [Thozetella sp. PMI_491]